MFSCGASKTTLRGACRCVEGCGAFDSLCFARLGYTLDSLGVLGSTGTQEKGTAFAPVEHTRPHCILLRLVRSVVLCTVLSVCWFVLLVGRMVVLCATGLNQDAFGFLFTLARHIAGTG